MADGEKIAAGLNLLLNSGCAFLVWGGAMFAWVMGLLGAIGKRIKKRGA